MYPGGSHSFLHVNTPYRVKIKLNMEKTFSRVCRTVSWPKKKLLCSFILLKKWNFATSIFVVPVFQQLSHSIHCICLSVCLQHYLSYPSGLLTFGGHSCFVVGQHAPAWCSCSAGPLPKVLPQRILQGTGMRQHHHGGECLLHQTHAQSSWGS